MRIYSAVSSHFTRLSVAAVLKGEALFRVFCLAASGKHQQKSFLNWSAQITTNLTDWCSRISSFKHPWSFPDTPVPCQLSAALGGLEAVCWMKRDPTDDSAATLIFLTCMFFFEELPGCNLASNSHQPIILTYTLKLFFFFFRNCTLCSQQTEAVFPKGPLLADLVRGEIRRDTRLSLRDVHTQKHIYSAAD